MPMRTAGNRRPCSCCGAVLNAKADEYILTKTMDFACTTDRNRICMLLFVVVTHELHMHIIRKHKAVILMVLVEASWDIFLQMVFLMSQ